MIGFAIIFCTLILAFIEKPHLFRTPIGAAKIFIITVLIALAIFSAIKEINDDKQQVHDSKTIDSLHTESKILNHQIDTLRKDNKIAQREYEDSLISYHNYTTALLARYGLKVDVLTGTIKRMDSAVVKEVPPTLTILNPPVIENIGNELRLSYEMQALNADAHLLLLRYIYINCKNGKPVDSNIAIVQSNATNYTSVIPKDNPLANFVFIDRWTNRDTYRRTEDFIFIIECYYKSKGNIRQVPIRKIYFVSTGEHPSVHEFDSEDHYRVSLILKKKGIWKTFYDL